MTRIKTVVLAIWLSALGFGLFAVDAHGALLLIKDRAFFAGIDHTFIDFETKGDGSVSVPTDVNGVAMPEDAYANLGVRIRFLQSNGASGPGGWLRNAAPTIGWNVAHALSGSLDTMLFYQTSLTEFSFEDGIHAFGLALVVDGSASLTVFDVDDNLLGELDFSLGGFTDGTVADEWMYGFMGLFSDIPIARVELRGNSHLPVDDLHFSNVPTPITIAPLLLAGLGLTRRKR